ncbi:MAG: hypothetical protein EOP33_01105 [Rickettsiaceae bacterium]|nr:MAG: hypothetical protein EOP33_01105 [Rickettsiaceae bacterium]
MAESSSTDISKVLPELRKLLTDAVNVENAKQILQSGQGEILEAIQKKGEWQQTEYQRSTEGRD